MSEFRDIVEDIASKADIVSVARSLGIQVAARRGNPRKAICPFHNDTDPSLHLYSERGGRRSNYHCYVCGAHGDIFELVKRRRNVGYVDAVTWLAEQFGVDLPQRRDAQWGRVSSRIGHDAVAKAIAASWEDPEILSGIAKEREFEEKFLRDCGVSILSLEGLIQQAANDPELTEGLVGAGVLRKFEDVYRQGELWSARLRGFFDGRRLLFPINNDRGMPIGYASRAIDPKDRRSKYLYSFNFPRRKTLYRADRVFRLIEQLEKGTSLDLFLVEGLFDALRLESVGLSAVAVLGSRLAREQLKVVASLRDRCDERGTMLTVHVFLDGDEAGRKGAYDAAIELIRLSSTAGPFAVKVVCPGESEEKVDPDTFLRAVPRAEARATLGAASVGVLRYLAAYQMERRPLDLGPLTGMKVARAAREIGLALRGADWQRAWVGLEASDDPDLAHFGRQIALYADETAVSREPTDRFQSSALADDEALTRALALARSSALRREFPTDDGSWERLAVAASAFRHIHSERLRAGDGPASAFAARYVPKDDGRVRVKCGPVPEDILLQQYMLHQLLTASPYQLIPAVRYWPASRQKITTTGSKSPGMNSPGECEETVSFAYQIDMDIALGVTPPRREGIFRHYYDCWRDFIEYVAKGLRGMPFAEVQILRLDISGFYDNIRRHVVRDALLGPLEQALAKLPRSDGEFAPLFLPEVVETPRRAEEAVEWLLKQSFGFTYYCPDDGTEKKLVDPDIGIPQGPDLSAYLANISLFKLDEAMRSEIAALNELVRASLFDGTPGAVGGIYARYVDDIIIVCGDFDTAARLRRTVETTLANMGLRLNRKHTSPPLMTKEAARAWLNDGRGAGLGFSGPLADLPTIDALDPLGDAGDIDRRTVLGLLFDPVLDDLTAPRHEVLNIICTALSAAGIKYNDRINALRRLWAYAADSKDADQPSHIMQSFVDLLVKANGRLPLAASGSAVTQWDVLLWLDALERFMRNGSDPGRLNEVSAQRMSNAQDRAARAFLSGLLPELLERASGQSKSRAVELNTPGLAHSALTCAIVAAGRLAKSASVINLVSRFLDGLPEKVLEIEAVEREIISLRRYASQQFCPIQRPLEGAGADRVLLVLHAAAARLQAFAESDNLETPAFSDDPLAPITPSWAGGREGLPLIARQIFTIWSPSISSSENNSGAHIDIDAASAFFNLTLPKSNLLAQHRPGLVKALTGDNSAKPLPNPPGISCPGLLAWCGENHTLWALMQTGKDIGALIAGGDWTRRDGSTPHGLTMYQSKFPNSIHLALDADRTPGSWGPKDIAKLYRRMHRCYDSLYTAADSEEKELLVTPFSLFGPKDLNAEEGWAIVAWKQNNAGGNLHAFVRNGSTAMREVQVPKEGAKYWRFGWAIRDLANLSLDPDDETEPADSLADQGLATPLLRRHAVLTRLMPRLCGRDSWGVGTIREPGGLPTRIERPLRHLQAFPEEGGADVQASFAVAALAEGMFMHARLNTVNRPIPLACPGGPTLLLARSTARALRGIQLATIHWPAPTPQRHPLRRTVAAWLSLSERLDSRVADLPQNPEALKSLASGCKVLAIESSLRDFALEQAACISSDDLKLLPRFVPNVSSLDCFGPDALLYTETLDAGTSFQEQAKAALEEFVEIVSSKHKGLPTDRLTPLGWAVVAGILGRLLDLEPPDADDGEGRGDLRPALRPAMSDRGRHEAAQTAFRQLLLLLGASVNGDGAGGAEWPWDAFAPLNDLSVPLSCRDIAKALSDLDSFAGLVVREMEGNKQPTEAIEETGAWGWRAADGTVHLLRRWQIDFALLPGDRKSRFESDVSGSQRRFRWTETREGERLLGAQVLSPSLAAAAFGGAAHHQSHRLADQGQSAQGRNTLNDAEVVQSLAATPRADAEADGPSSPPEASATRQIDWAGALSPGRGFPGPNTDILKTLTEFQESYWKERGKLKGATMFRVAFAQWDVIDSYESPERNYEGLLEADGSSVKEGKLIGGRAYLSLGEYRRRKVLEKTLQACAQFKVEGLILPEYSLRPETINWLKRRLKSHPSLNAVWAGTFRVPDAMMLDLHADSVFRKAITQEKVRGGQRFLPHEAVLCGLRKTDSSFQILTRQKRFPAAAVGEELRPPLDSPWNPLFVSSTAPDQLSSYALELVCSEIFIHASSANFPGLIEETDRLVTKYGLVGGNRKILEWITRDVHEFAKWTSIVPATSSEMKRNGPRRSLAIIPAMTTRTADYHIFGQNQHLAAGMVTAFCNAVHKPYGRGDSCFIGIGAWNGSKTSTLPPNPYEDIVPGIFRVNGGDTIGPLGDKEAAVVIVDLNAVNPTDHKPRPHYQPAPLRLVAHLPFIFATETGGNVLSMPNYPNRSRSHRLRQVMDEVLCAEEKKSLYEISDMDYLRLKSIPFCVAAEIYFRAIVDHYTSKKKALKRKDLLDATLKALHVLEAFADDPKWLMRRREAFHRARPLSAPGRPPAALLDWIWVDDEWKADEMNQSGESAVNPYESDRPFLYVPSRDDELMPWEEADPPEPAAEPAPAE